MIEGGARPTRVWVLVAVLVAVFVVSATTLVGAASLSDVGAAPTDAIPSGKLDSEETCSDSPPSRLYPTPC